MRSIQDLILEYLDNEEENNQNFSDLVALLTHQENITDVKDLKPILFLISKITKNHHRSSFFFEKIKKIINFLKNPIKQLFSNSDIFNIFKKNRRILLLLIELEIIKVDSAFSKKLQNYGDYFYPEIKDYINEEETKELPEQFEEKRRIGENDSYLCDLIRNDKIEDFIAYYNRSRDQISLTMTIAPSIFETNQFLLKNQNPTLIEYATFFGSIQILRFLFQNNVNLSPSLWLYAIHGQNPDIIHFLEENQIFPKDQSYNECLKESNVITMILHCILRIILLIVLILNQIIIKMMFIMDSIFIILPFFLKN